MNPTEDPLADFFTPEDFPPVDADAEQEVPAQLERLKSASYTGRDPEHLVSAVVDGDGMVTRIRFAGTAVTRAPQVVERAVATAIQAAQRQVDAAARAAVGKAFPHLGAAPEEDESYGGIEMAVGPTAHTGDGTDA
ncbi:hypothetical protein GCM10023322_27890 [Rugosimonospora acidiphila]|uniref:YbaB/EbfC DNA-binding family protein n=1 Tax=Rugosimonospora acidiphila TaxID=556531 RepID=A0ABP9RQW7_9ACTN